VLVANPFRGQEVKNLDHEASQISVTKSVRSTKRITELDDNVVFMHNAVCYVQKLAQRQD